MNDKKKGVFLPRTAYSTSFTSGLSVCIVNDECRFCSLSLIILLKTSNRVEFTGKRHFIANISVILI
jgi:hypothetical protein